MARDPLAKLIAQADSVAETASALVDKTIQRLVGDLKVLSGKLNIATSAAARSQVEAVIRERMGRLAKRLDALLEANTDMAAKAAAQGASNVTGMEVKYSARRAEAITALVTPAQGKNLSAVFTDQMATAAIDALRASTVRIMREQAVEGGSMRAMAGKLAADWQKSAAHGEVFRFVDSSGKEWDTRTYMQMNVRTNAMRVYNDCLVDDIAQATGGDLVRVSTGGDPNCRLCSPWEGVILSISGKTKGLPTYDEARNAGCFHPACVHILDCVDEVADADEIALQKAHPVAKGEAEDPDAQDERKYQMDQDRYRAKGLSAEDARVAVDRDNLSASIRHGLVADNAEQIVHALSDAEVTKLCPNGNPPAFEPFKATKRQVAAGAAEGWNKGSRGGVVHIRRDGLTVERLREVTKLATLLNPPPKPAGKAPAAKAPKTPATAPAKTPTQTPVQTAPTPPAAPSKPNHAQQTPAPNPPPAKSAKKDVLAHDPVPEFKTSKEGMEYITKQFGVTCVGFENFRPEFVRQIAEAVANFHARVGKSDALQLLGTFSGVYKHVYNKIYAERLAYIKALNPNAQEKIAKSFAKSEATSRLRALGIKRQASAYGCCRYGPSSLGFNGVSIHNHLQGIDRAQEVYIGFKAKGCEDPVSTVWHELGHALDHALGLNAHGCFSRHPLNAVVKDVWDMGKVKVADGLSEYGSKNCAEMVAEAWAEYNMNKAPRDIALRIGREIDRLCRERKATK